MLLREFRPSDLPALCQIDQLCFPPQIAYSSRELDRFIHHPKSRNWVAEEGGEILGFLVAGREPRKVGHIITIDVVESRRRAGLGTLFMNAVDEWAKQEGLKMIYLETADDNLTAQRFFTSRGYVKVNEVANYYPDGRTAWVMVKWLE